MLRLIAFLILLAPVTFGALWLADNPGHVMIEWQGYEIRMALGILLSLMGLLAVIIMVSVLIIRSIVGTPRRIKERQKLRQYENGLQALNRTMISIALADYTEADRQLRRSRHFLKHQPPVTRLLGVQIAHAAGKEDAARAAVDAMLEDEQTRPVALRGKIGELMQAGEYVHARDFAAEAFTQRPQDSWLAMVQLDIMFREKDWPAIDALIDRGKRKGALTATQASHYRAMLYLGRAKDALKDDQLERSQDLAQLALRQQPDLLPAMLIVAQSLARQQNLKALLKFLEQSWASKPHPVFAELFLAHACDEAPAKTLKRLQRLTDKNPDHIETQLLKAQIYIHLAEWENARNALKTALSKGESPRIYQMLAEVEVGEKGDDKQASNWLSQAVNAPKERSWVCTHCGETHGQWQPHCNHCSQFDAVEWTLPGEPRSAETAALA